MKKLIVNLMVAVVLFGGSLIGGLAATGRLTHEGVANIPVLNSFFPPPAEDPENGAEGDVNGANPDVQPTPAGEAVNATHSGERGVATEAGFSPGDQGEGHDGPRPLEKGKSVENPDAPAAAGGHGEAPDAGARGEGGGGTSHGEGSAPSSAAGASGAHQSTGSAAHSVEGDFNARDLALARDRANKYAPGGYFIFEGMPAGVTPEELNSAWKRVQSELADLEKRKVVLELAEKALLEREDDISRRQLELGKLREEIAGQHRLLDERIDKFKKQVKLVRNDEIEGLKRNAKTYENLGPERAAKLVLSLWKTDAGQENVLKIFELMKPDEVDAILQELDDTLIRDVLEKRLLVSREATPSKGRRK